MDPVGLAIGIVGLAGLFNTCLDIIDRASSYKHYGVETRSIVAQLEADKYLLQQWGQSVGIREGKVEKIHHEDLNNTEVTAVVLKILSSIKEIFTKKDVAISNANYPTGHPRFQEASTSSKLKWALKDKAKFIMQVQQFGTLVQKLRDLVPIDTSNTTRDENSHIIIQRDSNYHTEWLKIVKHIEAETKLSIDQWLDVTYTNDLYDNFLLKRLDGTCNWITSDPTFIEWISAEFPLNTAKTFWINGPAGYGKTIICASLVEYLSKALPSPLGYYFFSQDNPSRGDPFVIIRSWISQVMASDPNAMEVAHETWENGDGYVASRTDVMGLFKKIVQIIPNCTFVVDGLDECVWQKENWKTGNSPRIEFVEFLKQAVAQTNTRILIVSRDEVDIRDGLTIPADDPNHDLYEYKIVPEDVKDDVMLFSQSIVDKKLPNKPKSFRDDLSSKIGERSNGMFLWVRMQEVNLRGGKNKKQLENVIDQTPKGLEDLYDRNWKNIESLPENDRSRAFSILRWAAFAIRPLSINEITEALLIEDSDSCDDILFEELPDQIDDEYIHSEIVGLCESLIEVRGAGSEQGLGSRTIQLTHFSVKEYITCNMLPPGSIQKNALLCSYENFHCNELAKACLRYLNFRNTWLDSGSSDSKLNERAFREYAAGSWHHHITSSCYNHQEAVDLTNKFFDPADENWRSWRNWYNTKYTKSYIQKEDMLANPLYYASRLGLYYT